MSFKNRILISTLLVVIGGVILIGTILQIVVFPRLEDEISVITNLKLIHLFAAIVVVVMSWAFIEMISKRITLPLRELTRRADQISREAGKTFLTSNAGYDQCLETDTEEQEDEVVQGDEIAQLKTSFYRMLAHLKASEARIRESEERYRFLFDNGPFPLFVLDPDDMKILDVNEGAEKEYQYTRKELLGMNFWELGLPADHEKSDRLVQELAINEDPLMPVLQHRRKDGSPFIINLQARLSCWKGQQAIIAAVWDVTEKLEREAKLVQTGKMATLGEMATGIAHELNQPLNVIKLGSDFLLKNIRMGRTISQEDLARTAHELGANVDRAAHIIGHLREFGRKAELSMSPISINTPVRGVFTLLGTQFRKIGITCELSLSEDLPNILGDENRLEQVFINLVLNARDAMLQREKESGPTAKQVEKILTVKSFLEEDRVVVTIADTGTGLPPSLKARIFEPFFTTKKVGEGTGLGLSISYGIIKEHHGTIEVDGQDRQHGATFRLTFPVLDESAETNYDENSSL
ncbi:MAG: ATP-binding protein [Deltaproteobacteria bacterium]